MKISAPSFKCLIDGSFLSLLFFGVNDPWNKRLQYFMVYSNLKTLWASRLLRISKLLTTTITNWRWKPFAAKWNSKAKEPCETSLRTVRVHETGNDTRQGIHLYEITRSLLNTTWSISILWCAKASSVTQQFSHYERPYSVDVTPKTSKTHCYHNRKRISTSLKSSV